MERIADLVYIATHGLVSMRLLMAHSKELLVHRMAEVDALELRTERRPSL